MLIGNCLCGRVEFEVEDAFHSSTFCHCSRCRRLTGAGHSVFGRIEQTKLRVTKGADDLKSFGERYGTWFCGACGSYLFAMVDSGMAHVQLGALVDTPTIRPGEHIFVASKAEWEVIADGLPQWPGHSGQ